MAALFKDPRTGILYFRRVVPAALLPCFDGGSSEYKRALDTRSDEARQRYHLHAVVHEQKLAAAAAL